MRDKFVPMHVMKEFITVSDVCCQVEVFTLGWSLVQRSSTECGRCNWVWSWNLGREEVLVD